MLNKSKGNMYPWVTHTWNPIRGRCPHECTYCYMKEIPVGDLRIDMKSLVKDKLDGDEKVIFVGSSTDMFADEVKSEWIEGVLARCRKSPNNKYLFQTKNTPRLLDFINSFHKNFMLGTTIESDLDHNTSKAINPLERLAYFMTLPHMLDRMISIEPILKFTGVFHWLIRQANPKFVSIGADSKRHNLPEPSEHDIKTLMVDLTKHGIKVEIKKNLSRLF